MKINIKKTNSNAILPTYGTKNSAGADLYACITDNMTIKPHTTVIVPTGLSIEIPEGYVGLVFARSGLATREDLAPANKVGVIDSDYRGEIMVALHNHSSEIRAICPNERIAQLSIVPFIQAEWNLVDTLEKSDRGDGGFGSTGKF